MLQQILALARDAVNNPKEVIPFLKNKVTDYLRTHRVFRRTRYNGYSTYTVISAVYNVEKYLDDYFESITGQLLDFRKHITLILVDDGSTDSSASVIKQWQLRYPDNIIYIYKDNAGQGVARNTAIPLVQTPWVTFIDPDDFVDITYFKHVDTFLATHHKELSREKEIRLLSCNTIFYYESTRKYKDQHPLRARFSALETLEPITDDCDLIQLSASSAFYPVTALRESRELFPVQRWPSFEDAHWNLRYLLRQAAGYIAFARLPRYYYRKRADETSSVDTASTKKSYYLEQLREGYLDILQKAFHSRGKIPVFVQRAILYDMTWRIKRLYNKPSPAVLSATEFEEFFSLCRSIFSYIDTETIIGFSESINGLGISYKVGILSVFKSETLPHIDVFLEDYDMGTASLSLVYFQSHPVEETIFIDTRRVEPFCGECTQYFWGGKPFVLRRQLKIHLPSSAHFLNVHLGAQKAVLHLGQRVFQVELPVVELRAHFSNNQALPIQLA